MIAITTKRGLGPVRHALAQRIVAGTMVVHPPVPVRSNKPLTAATTAPSQELASAPAPGPTPPAEEAPKTIVWTPRLAVQDG